MADVVFPRAMMVALKSRPCSIELTIMLAMDANGATQTALIDAEPDAFLATMVALQDALATPAKNPDLTFTLSLQLEDGRPCERVVFERHLARRLVQIYMQQQQRCLAALIEHLSTLTRDRDVGGGVSCG